MKLFTITEKQVQFISASLAAGGLAIMSVNARLKKEGNDRAFEGGMVASNMVDESLTILDTLSEAVKESAEA